MLQILRIEGMTCTSCRAKVEAILAEVDGVRHVSVNLEKEEARLETDELLSVEALQKELPQKYKVSEKRQAVELSNDSSEEKSKISQLKPLFLILTYITIASLLLHYKNWDLKDCMLDFMGLFLTVFSFFKFLDLKGFKDSFEMYDPLAKVFPVYGWIYPFIESVLGLMFLLRFNIDIAVWITLFVLSVTTIGVTKTLLNKKKIRCACLGTALKLPMTEATFIENTIMMLMAIFMLIS